MSDDHLPNDKGKEVTKILESDGDILLYGDGEDETGPVDEEEGRQAKGDDGSDSDSSNASSNPHWPQSYRDSINLYSSATPPPLGLLTSPIGSFIQSSFRVKHTPDIIASFLKPLLHPHTTSHDLRQADEDEDEDEDEEEPDEQERRGGAEEEEKPLLHQHDQAPPEARAGAHVLPSRRSSSEKIPEDGHPPYGHRPDDCHPPHGYLPYGHPSHGHHTRKHCSFGQAVLNGMNVLCGVGILSTPYAVKEGGWADLCILLLFAVLAFYTGILLRKCLDSRTNLRTYPDIAEAAYNFHFRVFVSIVLYAELYACCVEYIILESDNLSSMFPNVHIDICGLHLNSQVVFALVATLMVLPTTWIKEQGILSYISVVGVAASVIVVLSLFWVGAVDNVGFKNKGTSLKLSGVPIAVGIYGYCYSGHAVFPNIYTTLRKRNNYPYVLFISFFICTVMFAGTAVMGYTMFGESTESQFTLDMPKTLVASKLAVWTTVVNPMTKYSLTMNPFAESLEELIPRNHPRIRMYEILIRSGLVISTLLVALGIPFFGLVMALIGSLLTMLVTFIFPCLCFLRLLDGKVTWFEKQLCIFIMVVGAISCFFGTISSLAGIVDNLS